MKKLLKITALIILLAILSFGTVRFFQTISVNKEQAEEALAFCKRNGYNTEFCILVDYSQSTWKKRMVLWDFNKQQAIHSCKCAHGNDGSEKIEATEKSFSNVPGSHKSSLGKYRIGKKRKIYSMDSLFDVSMFNIPCYELHGLDKTNSNAYKRRILLHPDPTLTDLPIFILPWHSYGCFSIPNSSFEVISKYIRSSSKPVLISAYYIE